MLAACPGLHIEPHHLAVHHTTLDRRPVGRMQFEIHIPLLRPGREQEDPAFFGKFSKLTENRGQF